MGLLTRTRETAPCVVTISHRFEELSAHVKFTNGAVVNPGDTVEVQGPEIMAPFGEIVEEERTAVITPASRRGQRGARAPGDFEFMGRWEFSGSEEVTA